MAKKGFMLLIVFIIFLQIAASVTKIEVNETEKVSLGVNAADPDNDQLNYMFAPPLDENGEWQTTYGDAGEYNLTVTISDGKSMVSEEVVLVVYKKEEPPVIDKISPERTELSVDEAKQIAFSINASDLNKDELGYIWELDGIRVEESERYVYSPYYGDSGVHIIKVNVAGKKSAVSQEWTVNVNKIDRERLLDVFHDIEINETGGVQFKIPDFKAYNLEYFISEPLGDGGFWQTTYDEAGEYPITIKIWDGNFTKEKQIKIKVDNVDRAPIFSRTGTQYVNENEEISIPLSATDLDGDQISFSSESLPESAILINSTIIWKPPYETVTKQGVLNGLLDKFHILSKAFTIKVIAHSNDLTSSEDIKVVVKDMNRLPVLDDISPIIVNEGEDIIITPSAIDPDGDKITYTYSGWMPSSQYTSNYEDSGIHFTKVTASDSQSIVSKNVKITVNNVNRAPVLNKILGINTEENSTVEFKIVAEDPDNDELSISALNLPEGSTIKEGIFRWKPDFSFAKDASKSSEIAFIATDGTNAAEQKAVITVNNVNRLPDIINATPSEITARVDEPVLLTVHAEDSDGDKLSYIWEFGIFEKYNATDSHQRVFSTSGKKTVKVEITDGVGSVFYEWKISILE